MSKTYRCVFLNNVAELNETEWGKLSGFVADGGGLVIGLGAAARPESYQSTTASQVVPATLDKISPAKPTTRFGEVTDFSHPLFQRYARELNAMLTQTDVYRYWVVTPREGSRVLLSYADKAPAVVERVFKGSKTGRVLLFTTPLSRRAESSAKDAWNDWPVVGWSFFFLMNQAVAHLAGTGQEQTDFEAGHDVVIPLDPTRRARSYTVQGPDRKASERLAPPPTSDSLVVSAPQQVGQWTVRPTPDDGTADTVGFSINVPVSETQSKSLETADLDALFGKDKYALADSPEKLSGIVNVARIGRELFPWIMLAILVIVTLENYLANRFYRETGPRAAAVPAV